MRIDKAVVLGCALLMVLAIGAPEASTRATKETKKTYVDPRGRFAFDYPAACSLSTGVRIEIEDPDGPTLIVDLEEVALVQATTDSVSRIRLMQSMNDWVNNNHFADGPDGSVHADGIRISRRFRTNHRMPAYEWSCDLIWDHSGFGTDDTTADSAVATEQDSVDAPIDRRPADPVFAVEFSRPGRIVVVWVAAREWTIGGVETRTMRSIVSSLRRP